MSHYRSAMSEITKLIHIQPTISSPIYQIRFTMQQLDDDNFETQSIRVNEAELIHINHIQSLQEDPELQDHLKDTCQSRDVDDHLQLSHTSIEASNQRTNYQKFINIKIQGSCAMPEPATAINQEEHDEYKRDSPDEKVTTGPEIKEEQEGEMARLDAEIEELTKGIEEMKALAQATVDELNRCSPVWGRRGQEMDLFDDKIRNTRPRIKHVK
ncbi:hypothetical protein ONS95_013359 [Cadophora gregata]|uniref:uncharacterized protein n=1 Tax=Cadophora gregata TaxID=51156 RepID=UPI0026DCDF80|nr:uncharacterized protein ONS95_013359 [Cadophora gregata]KAK0099748.1 hypothetical protein ONS96_008245 [Cadophora gregata f. sp. sojae]KAK0116338.1 hypothetical protein ONS95_013359 [Cadophora gregata]